MPLTFTIRRSVMQPERVGAIVTRADKPSADVV